MNSSTSSSTDSFAAGASELGELRCLVAEDHAFQRRSLVRILRGLGARYIEEAADGCVAVEFFRSDRDPLDLVLCDLDMPGMDGVELLRRMGEAGSKADVIVTSALDPAVVASVRTMARAYGVNVLGVLEKPVTPEALLKLVNARATPQPARHRGDRPSFTADEIREALRTGEFEPFYQPKVDIASGVVRGVEALARWRHPSLGVLLPDLFIPIITESGLMPELTWAILERAARACASWNAQGANLKVSVNLCATMLSDTALADHIAERVALAGAEPASVILEVTETAVMDVGPALSNLARLRMKGFGLSIDDFGTGYSSMQQLSRAPFTELKIDRSFVTDIDTNSRLRIMVQSMIDMAREMRLSTVAEGVETLAECQTLADMGCDIVQGYLISKPLEAAAFGEWRQARQDKAQA